MLAVCLWGVRRATLTAQGATRAPLAGARRRPRELSSAHACELCKSGLGARGRGAHRQECKVGYFTETRLNWSCSLKIGQGLTQDMPFYARAKKAQEAGKGDDGEEAVEEMSDRCGSGFSTAE
jgi:hypothetical protein